MFHGPYCHVVAMSQTWFYKKSKTTTKKPPQKPSYTWVDNSNNLIGSPCWPSVDCFFGLSLTLNLYGVSICFCFTNNGKNQKNHLNKRDVLASLAG